MNTQFAVETVGESATERVRLPPPWLRGGNVVPRIKSDDPYLQIVQPQGVTEEGTPEVTTSSHEVPLGGERGGHTTVHRTTASSETASVPLTISAQENAAAWQENREDIQCC